MSFGKSAHAEEPSHTVDDSGAQSNQEFDTGNNDDQPAVEAASRDTYDTTHTDKPRTSFDELMDTLIDFYAIVINWLNITNLTQEVLVRSAFNLLKGTCKSRTELEYHFKECFKATADRLDWNNPEGQEYPLDLSKPLPLVEDYRGRQVVPVNYFINNELKYLKDMVPSLWSPAKKLSNLALDVPPNFGVALRMYTRRIVLIRVEDLQLGVKSYHKKLNITRPETFRSDISNMTPYTAYKNPPGIIYVDKHNRNKLMRTDELYKFSDGMLTSVRAVLHDITSSMRMDYLLKRRWSNLDRKRSRIMMKKIDQTLFEIRMMRNLEKFVGGRDYGEHLKLLQRTI
ncbi:hypothetical protein Tco_1328772 [Tanacetum coccineum]